MTKSVKDNLKYKEMITEDRVFIPDLQFDFPEDDPFRHTVEVVYNSDDALVFDGNYPYLDDSPGYKWESFKLYAGLYTIAFPANLLKFGLKIKGKDILRKYVRTFKDGAITVCNHCCRWDMVSVLYALRYRRMWVPIYGQHLMGTEKWFMRYVGGIPVPDTKTGFRAFNEAFDELHRRKQWIHVFPESCSWRYYVPIRPFQKGAFTMAYKYNLPILPFAISYRKRTGIYRLFDKPEVPLITLNVCEPVFPDLGVPRREDVARMREEAHSKMVRAAGIIKNPWPAAID